MRCPAREERCAHHGHRVPRAGRRDFPLRFCFIPMSEVLKSELYAD